MRRAGETITPTGSCSSSSERLEAIGTSDRTSGLLPPPSHLDLGFGATRVRHPCHVARLDRLSRKRRRRLRSEPEVLRELPPAAVVYRGVEARSTPGLDASERPNAPTKTLAPSPLTSCAERRQPTARAAFR